MLLAERAEAVVETAFRWRDQGGTHAAVVAVGQGFAMIDAHVDYRERAADALRKADPMSAR